MDHHTRWLLGCLKIGYQLAILTSLTFLVLFDTHSRKNIILSSGNVITWTFNEGLMGNLTILLILIKIILKKWATPTSMFKFHS